MKKVERQGKKVGYEYVPGGSKSKCVSAEADKSVWPGSRKFRNAFQNGTNSFLKVHMYFLIFMNYFWRHFFYFREPLHIGRFDSYQDYCL